MTRETHEQSQEEGNSDCNHPVLARMMRALKSQQQQDRQRKHKQSCPKAHMPAKSQSEELFVSNKSFAASNSTLFGRQTQSQQLQHLLDQLLSQPSANNANNTNGDNNTKYRYASYLALVHGKSGSGKSSLIDAFAKTIHSHQRPIFFTAGKFDQLKTHLPYAALIKAANDLARKVVQSPHANDIKRRIFDELGPDVHLLASIVEELSIFSSASPNQQKQKKQNEANAPSSSLSSTGSSGGGIALTGKAITRFKLLLRSFMRSIATRDTPVVLFFDDLQWADEATMEMLKALLTDKLSKHVLLILAYRDDEMDPETLQKHFSVSALDMDDESQQQQQQQQQQGEDDNNNEGEEKEEPASKPSSYLTHTVHRTEIPVPNLDQHTLNQMVSTILNEPEYSTTSLTDIILNKTQGNPFYTLNFMDLLYANGMLYQDEENKAWEWDESIILQQTDVSDNLAQILEAKILRLPEKVRSILQLAAFIGHDFASSILTTIVYEEQDMIEGEYSFDLFDKQVIQRWIIDALNLALQEGLVELSTTAIINQKCETSEETTCGEGTYKFSHDRIQQCLYKDLMPDDVERRLLHQRIGKLIWNTISSQDCDTVEDWILFLAADNLNRGPKFVDDDGDRAEMVELNLRAGKLAASKAAFLVGVEYLRHGDKLITDDVFVESNYDLCMELWCTAADMERIVGDFPRSNELGEKIHKYAREIEDHFPAYLAEIKCLAMQGEAASAMKVAFEVLGQMGVKFAKKITSLTVAQEFIQTKFKLGNRTPEELLEKLPLLTDRKKLFALQLLNFINGYAFMVGESAKFTFVAVGLRMTNLTLQYGLSELYAPYAFVGYGFVCCFFGKFDEGLAFGDAAQRLLERFDTQSNIAPRTQLYYLNFIRPWSFGINEALTESYLQVYHKGMMVGDVDCAYAASAEWLFCGYNGAVPLKELVARGTRIRLEMEEYGQKTVLLILVPCLQAARIMLGDKSNQNPAILSGEDMDLEEFTEMVEETKSGLALFVLSLYELTIAIFFGDWERIQMKMPIIEKLASASEGHYSHPVSLLVIVWSSYKLYDMTGKKRHRQIGRQHHQTLKRYAKLNSPLAITFCKMLAAAKAAFVKKKPVEECEELFVSALQDLERAKNHRLQSLVADELAELFLKVQNIEKAVRYLQESMECSIRWGAKKKVKYLERKLSVVLEMVESIQMRETYDDDNCASEYSFS